MGAFTQLTLALAPSLHGTKAGALQRRIEPGWQASAACAAAVDPDAWFPARSTPRRDLAGVLAVCEVCPVRRSCLAAGLLGHEAGVWGGTTEDQRDAALDDLNAGDPVDSVLDRLLAVPVETPASTTEKGAA
jgi:hypothetical protein